MARRPNLTSDELSPAIGSSPASFDESSRPETLRSDLLLGTATAAKLLNISPVHLRRLCRAGKTPLPLKVGYRKLAWRLSVLTKFIADREEAAQRESADELAVEVRHPEPIKSGIPRSTVSGKRRQ